MCLPDPEAALPPGSPRDHSCCGALGCSIPLPCEPDHAQTRDHNNNSASSDPAPSHHKLHDSNHHNRVVGWSMMGVVFVTVLAGMAFVTYWLTAQAEQDQIETEVGRLVKTEWNVSILWKWRRAPGGTQPCQVFRPSRMGHLNHSLTHSLTHKLCTKQQRPSQTTTVPSIGSRHVGCHRLPGARHYDVFTRLGPPVHDKSQ